MPRDYVYCLIHRVKYDLSWRFYGLPIIQRRRGSLIRIGRNVTMCSSARRNSIGIIQPVILKTNASNASIVIGDYVGMSGCTISASCSISIGDHVLIGSGVLITDSDAHAIDWSARRNGALGNSRPIVIEDDVFIGARAIILKGVRLGRGAVIGAGSVVTQDVDAHMLVAGNPAHILRSLVAR